MDLGEWADYDDPAMLLRLEGYARASAGESADLDGDGRLDVVVLTDPDGTRRWRYELGYGQSPAWESTLRPDGTSTTSLAFDANGFPAVVVERSPGHIVETSDTDGNGHYDARRTVTWVEGAATLDIVVETDPAESQAWHEVSRSSQSRYPTQGQEIGCEPDFWSTPIDNKPGPPLRLLAAGQYSCAGNKKKAVQSALACALRRASNCLSMLNASFYQELDHRFMESDPVMVGCAKPCATAKAQAEEFGSRMLFYENGLADPEQACETALHELLHIIGARKNPEHELGNRTDDLVFACAGACGTRSCSEMVDDCTKCAMPPSVAADLCGSQFVVDTSAACPNQDWCRGNLGTLRNCQVCRAVLEKSCDYATQSSSDLCCLQCPADANAQNVNPCTSDPTPPPSTCGTANAPICWKAPFASDLRPP